MSDSNVRRIKRALLIKGSSIKFLSENDLNELKKIKLIEGYIIKKEKEISEYNLNLKIDDSSLVNGRSLTNLGLFRIYIEEFLDNNPSINSEMTLMCRQLTPTSQGVPLEIYAFSKDQDWKKYEDIMSDIFDHLLASLKTFHLELFELPSSLNNKVNE